jgi:cyclase
VAHERCRDGVLASGLPANLGVWTDVDWDIPELAPPFLTYADAVTVWSGDLKCDVRYVGMPAHTTNDSLIWLPERSVLFAGDLAFSGGTPFLLMGSVEGAIEVLEHVVRPLGAQTIVPGHGPVSGPAVIDEMLGYLRFVLDVARRGMAAGLSPLDAARQADLGGYAGLLDSERIVGNLHRAYAELAGAPRGAEVDLIAALTDMISYNGGRPLTCHA